MYRSLKYYLFVEDGVFEVPSNFDSSASPDGIPLKIAVAGSPIRVIYATSPSSHRWKSLHQVMEKQVIVMNPWTLWEIHQAYEFIYRIYCV
jgi:hypothetical protein